MLDPRIDIEDSLPRAADGRVAGRRGRATRQRLLEATNAALAAGSFRDLKVVEISRRADTSPATFYQYFPDVEAAVLSIMDELADSGGQRLRVLITEPSWDTAAAAAGLANGFFSFFEEYGELLRVVDLAALDGDLRFRQLRTRLFNGVFLAMQDLAHEKRAEGFLDESASPGAIAGVLTTMLAHVSAHRHGFADWGVSEQDLASTMADIIRPLLGGDYAGQNN